MFAIYTPNGRSFSGPLEELYHVQKSKSSEQTNIFQQLDEFSPLHKKGYSPSPKAIDAYNDTIGKPDEKALICHAYQIMTSPVEVISANDLLTEVINKFTRLAYQEFPIVNTQQQLVGSLSRQQLYEYLLKHGSTIGKNLKTKSVANLFLNEQSKIYTAEPVTEIRRIALLQINNRLHTTPILEPNGKVVGIISRTDIIKAITMDPPLSLWC
ncbi:MULTISPECIES: CBS domain-containing protein [unclassified Colwellia]|uniref:CBS domain-containing protein n=1 Tax=unclassified Colwellia TaxID=196834 RepID=UPI0015F68123|nr:MULTISPECIES: CBS domain-containing protein [unclassified Colwellia]MBA6233986.1 CBS domain-containing protein [Colwellia sp. MB02u-7]MBA6236950.1 CBS domain-containing protein [Colwellia sp. MB02u-11]MBA6256107.1 CBS domain-containing protein [Colwellia sp. MB3u-28]MBA6259338.1 CBS domain-containing protein [Colwellia sp. MB3u-41]MBA6300660.1 CBS domain-containing protein [Colwellia sp. MB3u-22]